MQQILGVFMAVRDIKRFLGLLSLIATVNNDKRFVWIVLDAQRLPPGFVEMANIYLLVTLDGRE